MQCASAKTNGSLVSCIAVAIDGSIRFDAVLVVVLMGMICDSHLTLLQVDLVEVVERCRWTIEVVVVVILVEV